MLFASTANS